MELGSTKEIRQKLQEETQKQIVLCGQEINAAIKPILEKYQFKLDISIILRQNQVIPQLGVIPK